MKKFVSWFLIRNQSDLLNGNLVKKKSSSPIFFQRNFNNNFSSEERIKFLQKLNKSKKNTNVNKNNYSLGDMSNLKKYYRNFSNDFFLIPPLNKENRNNNNIIKTLRTTRIFQSTKKDTINKNNKMKLNKRYSFNDLPSLKKQKKKMIEKLIYREGENDTNGNNLYDDDKHDNCQKIYIENNCTIMKESLTKPYVKNKKNEIKENIINEDNNYGKKIQNIKFKKIHIPLIESNKFQKNKILERMKKEKRKNFVNINNKSMRNMKNNFLNIFYNEIQNLNKEINQINNKIFNIYVEGRNIFNS